MTKNSIRQGTLKIPNNKVNKNAARHKLRPRFRFSGITLDSIEKKKSIIHVMPSEFECKLYVVVQT